MHECAAAILRRPGQVLLCHRTPEREWFPNVWDLPGGHVEPGETAALALVRELREELAIEIVVPSTTPHQTMEDGTLDLRMHIWVLEEWRGVPANRAPEEHDRLGWFDLSAIAELDLADDRYRALLRDVMSPPPPA